MELPHNFVQIDEDGFGVFGELRINDSATGAELLRKIEFAPNGALLSRYQGAPVIIEAFDEPYIAESVTYTDNQWKIHLPYGVSAAFELQTLTLDEWDRFHGVTENRIPFVLSKAAQNSFFNLLDSFDDDSITFHKIRFEIPPSLQENANVESAKYWTDVYNDEGNPGWNLGAPAEALKDMLPRLKLPKSRILVVGCGEGHDAAFFAESGHVVTAIDFSEEAIARAKKNYGHFSNLSFLQRDALKLGTEFDSSFDIVFEHTCFCAINPTKRQNLVKVWRQVLHDQGQLMGVFFTMSKKEGPPYGSSEWELRRRLQGNFQFLFWGRWRQSLPGRQGKELFLLAQKRKLI